VVCAVLNTVLDLVFVLALNLDSLGVGIATIIAQAISWIFGVFYINRKYPQYKISVFKIKFEKDILLRAIKLGLPAGIQQMLFSIGVLTMSALINTYDESFVAGFTAANKIDAFAFMPITSFSNAATTFVGQNIGAGRMDRVKVGVRSAVLMSVAVSIVIAAILYPLGGFFMSLFNQSPDVIASGCEYLYRILPFYWMLSITFIINGSLRGAGSSIVPMISATVSLWLARVPAAYLLSSLGQNEIFWCFAIGWVPGIIISGGYFLSGKWKNKSIINAKEQLPQQ
jgi:putative MATE family efflux protein